MQSLPIAVPQADSAKPSLPKRGSFGLDVLPTSDLAGNLGRRAISSGFITVAAQGFKLVLTVSGAMVLSRLLSPRDFGLIGMVSAVTAFLNMLTDAGLSTATIQAVELCQAQASNLFWINVGLSGAIGLVAASLAPAIAWFYQEPKLLEVTMALACTFPLTGMALQHRALLARHMRFGVLAVIEVGAMLTSITVASVMALARFGYWSLVGMQISAALCTCILTWSRSGWRPNLPSRGRHTWSLLGFGMDLTASSLIYRFARGADTLLLGRIWGATAVGLYNRASVLLVRPMDQLLSPVSSVLLPVLSRLQGDPQRYRGAFLRAYDAIALVSFPFSALFLATARPLVLVLLGPQWDGVAVLFAGFTLTALYLPLSVATTWLFTSQGRGRELLITNIVLSAITIVSFVAGAPGGAMAMVLSFSLSGLAIRLPLLYYFAGRRGPVETRDLWMGFVRQLPIWLMVYGVTWWAGTLVPNSSPWTKLAVCLPMGAVAGLVGILAFRHARMTAANLLGALVSSVPVQGCVLGFRRTARFFDSRAKEQSRLHV